MENQRKDSNLVLIGNINHQILGAKLPSNRQVFSVYFHNTRVANLFADEVAIFYNKARIPTAKTYK